jgi:transcription initiation factor TFIID subunit 11
VSAASSAHPLRQTSFPPPDSLEAQHALAEDNVLRQQYSPSAEGSLDGFSDDDQDIRSAISGPAGGDAIDGGMRKRKRGEKRPRGRPAKQGGLRAGSASLANGEDGGRRGARSVISTGHDADAEPDDEDEDEDNGERDARGGRVPLYEGGQMTPAGVAEERERKNLFYAGVGQGDHRERYAAFGRAKLRNQDVKKLVNQILGQSVPQNVVLVVSAYTKMFAGQLIEEAREVQAEWTAVQEERADGSENPVWKKLKRSREAKVKAEVEVEEVDMTGGQTNEVVKNEPTSPDQSVTIDDSVPTTNGAQANGHTQDDSQKTEKTKDEDDLLPPGGAGGLGRMLEECDRGPLLPDHLREALRRYKKRRGGGSVGFTGLSLEGSANTAPRMGGRRLFR